MKKLIASIAAIAALAIPATAVATNDSPNHGQTNAWCKIYKDTTHGSEFYAISLTYWSAAVQAVSDGNYVAAKTYYSYARHYLDLHFAYAYICR